MRLLDKLLGVRVDNHVAAIFLQQRQPLEKVRDVVDGFVSKRRDDARGLVVEPFRDQEARGHFARIIKMYGQCRWTKLPAELGRREPAPHQADDLEDMLACAERVGAKIGAGAKGIARLQAAQRHLIRFAAQPVGDGVIGPRLLAALRLDAHLFFARALLPVGQGPFDEVLLRHASHGLALRRRRRQAQRRLFLQHHRQHRADMIARHVAVITAIMQSLASLGHHRHGDDHGGFVGRRWKAHAQQIAGDINVIGSAYWPSVGVAPNQFAAFRA